MNLLALLVTIIILGVVFYLLTWLVDQIPMAPPFRVVAKVVLALFAVVLLLGLLLGGVNIPMLKIS